MTIGSLAPRKTYQRPDVWWAFGHSWILDSRGTLDQTGRFDAIFRQSMDVELNEWRNWAVTGSSVIQSGLQGGGWARAFSALTRARTAAPYWNDGGGYLLCWGINDMGLWFANGTQKRAAIQHAFRAVISRCRSSRILEDTDAAFAYGAGFTSQNVGADLASGGTVRRATTTAGNATVTFTIPADYGGQPLVFCFTGKTGLTGGTVTFSGTAGVTGTLSTSNITATGGPPAVPVVRRLTTLTAANAGQTIIMSATAIDGGGQIDFDGAWIEATAPPPVLVCNVARIPDSGYFPTNPIFTQAGGDTEVQQINTDLVATVAEFDAMVQLVDLDTAIGKNASYFPASDSLHINEAGAAACADAVAVAVGRLSPPTALGESAHFQPPSPKRGQRLRPMRVSQYYTADYRAVSTYTPVVGDQWALPLEITEGRCRIDQFVCEVTTAGSTQSTIRWALFDDPNYAGYPLSRIPFTDPTDTTAFSLTNSIGPKTQTISGSIIPALDPGLYWLVLKVATVGTSQVLRALTGPCLQMPNLSSTGAVLNTTGGPMAWKLTGQGAGSFASQVVFPAGAVLSDVAPLMGCRVSVV